MTGRKSYVRLVDAIAAKFDEVEDYDEATTPLPVCDASSVHEYMRSFWTQMYDWTRGDELDPTGHLWPSQSRSAHVEVAEDDARSSGWSIRVFARLSRNSPALAVFGVSCWLNVMHFAHLQVSQ